MRRGGIRIHLERFFKGIDRAFKVHAVQTALAGLEVRFLFLVQFAGPGGQTTGEAGGEENRQREASRPHRKLHGAKLNEPSSARNCALKETAPAHEKGFFFGAGVSLAAAGEFE